MNVCLSQSTGKAKHGIITNRLLTCPGGKESLTQGLSATVNTVKGLVLIALWNF